MFIGLYGTYTHTKKDGHSFFGMATTTTLRRQKEKEKKHSIPQIICFRRRNESVIKKREIWEGLWTCGLSSVCEAS